MSETFSGRNSWKDFDPSAKKPTHGWEAFKERQLDESDPIMAKVASEGAQVRAKLVEQRAGINRNPAFWYPILRKQAGLPPVEARGQTETKAAEVVATPDVKATQDLRSGPLLADIGGEMSVTQMRHVVEPRHPQK